MPDPLIASAIVRLGKPFDERRINAAKKVVASYLEHPDSLIRHEAIWFLACWGKLREYRAAIIQAMKNDPDEDNRGFAANCLGVLESGTKDKDSPRALAEVVRNASEEPRVRVKAYGALLEVFYGEGASELSYPFQMGDKDLSEVNWKWLESIAP